MTKAEVEEARAYCLACPVRRECLADSLSTEDRFGIWGGLTSAERGRALDLLQSPAGVMSVYDAGNLLELVRKL